MTHLSLFSGIGGIDLAAHWAGFKTVACVERDPFCQKVLAKNFPGVPIYDDVATFDGWPFRGRTDLLSGGFPCQDISQANKKRDGLDGARSGLWFQMLRVIESAAPAYVVAENVAALLGMGIDVCLSGMEDAGYATWTVVVPAAGVGAWHRRERCFLIGRNLNRNIESDLPIDGEAPRRQSASPHTNGLGGQPLDGPSGSIGKLRGDQSGQRSMEEQARRDEFCGVGADPTGIRGATDGKEPHTRQPEPSRVDCMVQDFGERSRVFEPKLCGDVHGFPGGLDAVRRRLRALGNAVVPQQVYPILKAIREAY